MSTHSAHAAELDEAVTGSPSQKLERSGGPESYGFGRYLAVPAARTLTCDGAQIELGSRAFDLLIVLLRSRGQIVSKNDIVHAVWPSTTVDESNLRFQMTCLRKALRVERERIKTIPGRGYLFVSEDTPFERSSPITERDGEGGQGSPDRKPAIVIFDENQENREALQRLLRPFNAYVHSFRSVEAFLASGMGARQTQLVA